jgi:YggT family protein
VSGGVGLVLHWALLILLVLVVLRIVLSWFPPGGELMRSVQGFVFTATEWLLGPLRRVLPPLQLGGAALDLSPTVVILVIYVLLGIVH